MPAPHRLALPAVAALLALAPTGASAASPTCETLKGKDLVKGRTITVVDRRSRSGRHTYLACTEPRGKARALKASRPGGRLELLDDEGAFLAVRDPASRRVDVVNVLRGTRERLFGLGANPAGRAVVVGGAGEAAALVRKGSTTSLVGFDFDGAPYTLDSGAIPASSLKRGRGQLVSWTKGGAARSADLTEPAVDCAELGGKVEQQTPTLRVTSFTYDDEFLVGEIDGRTRRTRACVRASGVVRVLGEASFATDGVQGGTGFVVPAAAGTFVVERASASDSQGDFRADELVLHELESGKRTRLWGTADAKGPNTSLGDASERVVLTADGRVATIFAGETSESVVDFSPSGTPRTLDTGKDIDDASLALSGTTLSWRNAGAARTKDLTQP